MSHRGLRTLTISLIGCSAFWALIVWLIAGVIA